MIRQVFDNMLLKTQSRYDYDVGYLRDILRTDLGAFAKFAAFQLMAAHSGNLPPGPLAAARIRSIIWDDCGPCAQLIVSQALESGVSPDVVRAIVDKDLDNLPAANFACQRCLHDARTLFLVLDGYGRDFAGSCRDGVALC